MYAKMLSHLKLGIIQYITFRFITMFKFITKGVNFFVCICSV